MARSSIFRTAGQSDAGGTMGTRVARRRLQRTASAPMSYGGAMTAAMVPHALLGLQNAAGNQSVQRLLTASGASSLPPSALASTLGPRAGQAIVQRYGGEGHAGRVRANDPAVQRQAIDTPRIQRAPAAAGQRPPLTSPRFAGDPVLEACHQDKARLAEGARGEPVQKIQQALIDLGFDVGPTGADKVYGAATARAVREFKAKEKLGFEQFGDVGPGTMSRLDQLFPAGPTPPKPTPNDAADADQTSGGEEGEALSCPTDENIEAALEANPTLADSVRSSVVASPTVGAPPVTAPHVSIPTIVARFKQKVDAKLPGGARDPGHNISRSGQFFIEASMRKALVAELNRIGSSGQLEAMEFETKGVQAINAEVADDTAKVATLLKRLDFLAANSISTEKPAMQAFMSKSKKAGGAIDAELFAAFDASTDDAIPSSLLAKFRTFRDWRAVSDFDNSACGNHAIRVANRIAKKGGLAPRIKKGASVSARLATGTGTNDMRPSGSKDFLRGDVINQTGVSGAVSQMRAALDAGRTVHARVLSGIGYGIDNTSAGTNKTNPKAVPVPISKPPPEEHSILIIGYDGNKFVFHDADAKSSASPERGFGLLFFAGGRLTTAQSDSDLVVNTDGEHSIDGDRSSNDHRYQVISLQSI